MATDAEGSNPGALAHGRQLVDRGRARARAVADGVEASRERRSAVDIALSTAERDRASGGVLFAGALAFRGFLWLLPASLLTVLALGLATSTGSADPSAVVDHSGLPALATSPVAEAARQDDRGRVVAIVVALVLLWTASGALLKVLRTVHGFAWRVTPPKLANKVRARALFLLIALGSIALVSAMSALRGARPGMGLAVMLGDVVIFTALWWLISWLLPHADAPAVALLPGAALLGGALQVMHLVTVLYLAPRVASASELYGDLGGAATLLIWLYLLSRLVVASAMLNAAAYHRRLARPDG